MATNDDCPVLTRLCTENVYNENIFHILGLRTDVTPRQIRRRREDIDTANEFGGDAWKREFRHVLGNLELPDYQEVCETFSRLEDPEERIVSEFFWFWTTGDGDEAIEALQAGRKSDAIKAWEAGEYSYGKSRLVALHNLAVLYHFYALDAELQAVAERGIIPADFRMKMCGYWEKSFDYWEQLADNDDFWDLFTSRVREFDDPRLTGGFVRRFRSVFPLAFDNINARIAAEYAKVDDFADARRHVNYMLKTMSGLDDVESTLNVLFEPMENKVKLLIDSFDEKIKKNPKEGLQYSRSLLKDTEEIRRVAVGMLSEGQKIRTALLSDIAWACNRYQVAYGNATEDWRSCLAVLQELKEVACTPELKKRVEENIKTVQGNLEYKKMREMCWVCQKNKADRKYGMKMYGDVRHEWGQIKWRHGEIDIPVCSHCQQQKESADSTKAAAFWISAIIVFIIGCCIAPQAFIIWGLVAAAVGGVVAACAGSDNGFTDRCKEHPAVKEMLSKGWKFGEKPPTN